MTNNNIEKRRAVFLDRDGTIIEDAGYIDNVHRIRMLPHACEAIKLLNDNGYAVVVVTNQSGVARGFFEESLIAEIHSVISQRLSSAGAHIDRFYYCPHHPETGKPEYRIDCNCRKPRTGMIETAQKDLNIDICKSYMIGDKVSDIELAKNAGISGILVRSGYGSEVMLDDISDSPVKADHISKDLYDAVEWILCRDNKE